MIVANGPRTIVEIGTFDGRTTLNIATNAPDGAIVYTLDLPQEKLWATGLPIERPGDDVYIDKSGSGSRYRGADVEGRTVQLYGDSAGFDYSPYEKSVDFVFVDGAHSYEYVLNDTEVAFRLLRDGAGMIVWHDYGNRLGVVRALDELYLKRRELATLRHIEGTSLVYLRLLG